ncbi:MAG: DUF5685 family protein [Oscillospiraceae bacterium]|jgi:hypothetical protein
MFGYILPMAGELKVKEFQKFKSAYCGLCHEMGRKCGWKARFLLNYDFTFLAMLLDDGSDGLGDRMCRCIASPFRRRRVCAATKGFEMAADASVILSFWQLRDTVQDEGFFRGAVARLLSVFLRRSYRKAAKRRRAFDSHVRQCLSELRQLELERCPSLDRAADTFAKLLQGAGAVEQTKQKSAIEEVLYHIGRWIYLADAYDDLEEDFKRGRYNPLIARFALTEPLLPEQERTLLETTMRHSLNLAASAYALLQTGHWSDILDNILYLGLPASGMRVRSGKKIKWNQSKKIGEIIYE